jgi:hypothetical protein
VIPSCGARVPRRDHDGARCGNVLLHMRSAAARDADRLLLSAGLFCHGSIYSSSISLNAWWSSPGNTMLWPVLALNYSRCITQGRVQTPVSVIRVGNSERLQVAATIVPLFVSRSPQLFRVAFITTKEHIH